MKKILLINPKLEVDKEFIDYPYFVNQGIYAIREIIKEKNYDVEVFDSFLFPFVEETESCFILGNDSSLKNKIDVFCPDLVIILNSPFLKLFGKEKNENIFDIVKYLRFRKSKVILSDLFITGMHYFDYNPEEIKKRYNFDWVFKHESELSILKLLEGSNVKNEIKFVNKLDELPFPKFSKEEVNKYNEFLLICQERGIVDNLDFKDKLIFLNTSRGCVNNCIFCPAKIFLRNYRPHSINYIEKQLVYLKSIHGIKNVILLDDLLNPTKERLFEIIGLLKKHKFRCQIPNGLRLDNLDLKTLKGLKGVTERIKVSAETGDKKTLKKIDKDLDSSKVKVVAEMCKKIGLKLFIHFIIGFDFEKVENMNNTIRFAIQLYKESGAIPLLQIASPIKGAKLFDPSKHLGYDYMDYFSCKVQKNKESLKKLRGTFKILLKKEKFEKLIVNVSYKCNNNCVFCATGGTGTRGDRRNLEGDFELQVESMKKARVKGVSLIDFDGGEPTIDKNFFRLLNSAKELGFTKINVTTNGRMLSDKNFVDKMIESGVTSILISLHGFNEEIHEKLTGVKGSFIETIKAIDNLVNMKNKKISVGANITLVKQNADNLINFVDLLEIAGIEKINLQMLTPFGVANKNLVPSEEELSRSIGDLMGYKKEKTKINFVNFQPCILENVEVGDGFLSDFFKSQREMLFIDRKQQNLAKYLERKRYKTTKCKSCEYDLICGGFWNFNETKKS